MNTQMTAIIEMLNRDNFQIFESTFTNRFNEIDPLLIAKNNTQLACEQMFIYDFSIWCELKGFDQYYFAYLGIL